MSTNLIHYKGAFSNLGTPRKRYAGTLTRRNSALGDLFEVVAVGTTQELSAKLHTPPRWKRGTPLKRGFFPHP